MIEIFVQNSRNKTSPASHRGDFQFDNSNVSLHFALYLNNGQLYRYEMKRFQMATKFSICLYFFSHFSKFISL